MAERVRFIHDIKVLDKMRKSGIKVLTGIKEVIDNSVDANASEIRIHLEDNENTVRVTVIDDGVGIPSVVPGHP